MSQPRAELFAAVLNAHTGEVVKRSLGKYHQSYKKLTDSQIALHWVSSSNKPLKQWARNRVIEIRRFTLPEQWKYVRSKDMIADLGTRKGVKNEQVDQDSVWKNVFELMKLESSQFPTKTVKEIWLDKDEISTLKSEFIVMIQVIYCNLNSQVEIITMETLPIQKKNASEHPSRQRY